MIYDRIRPLWLSPPESPDPIQGDRFDVGVVSFEDQQAVARDVQHVCGGWEQDASDHRPCWAEDDPATFVLTKESSRADPKPLYNPEAHPFLWTATADSIIQKIQRLCHAISGAGH